MSKQPKREAVAKRKFKAATKPKRKLEAPSRSGASAPPPAGSAGGAAILPTRNGSGGRSLGVSIRMYRLGVGDCFLVSFRMADGGLYRMLIDCGVHQSQPGGGALINKVVADLRKETGGKIDVIVATHEHWDHISGFAQAEDIFKTFSVGEVWAAWTEDANDKFANSLREKRGRALAALGRSEARMRLAGRGDVNSLTGLLGFFGDTSGKKLAQAGNVLRALAGGVHNIKYRNPGETPIEVPGAQARIFVLGPPRNAEAIHRSHPKKSTGEVYSFGAYGDDLDAIEPALDPQAKAPFDSRFTIPLAGTKALSFFQKAYWSDGSLDENAPRLDDTREWRRIDDDWLDAATSLGLKLDEDTNNTSLVLAIEFSDPGKDGPVLLFAADAQVGNWLSWQNVEWDYNGRKITGPQLLRRTILYKVGHHASDNATLKDLGLELMDNLETALVPTDAEMAQKVGWGTLPWPNLLSRLGEKTKGRVIRTDRELPAEGTAAGIKADKLFYQIDL